ncbi:uncharacterized protein LOC100578165 isoform X1 [Apis mellifera]|uniref:Uncharacterized protein LOC100578165 isoform X1 n=1 Tax=Apis mellifera TaxID=7460 RepID=A0A7M7GQ82_APIME|nr:uncharacterized protein LOC100578165 isoform X1 [Apis mellifera]|eukprot:XP_006559834.1 uncharacterized protein LOC100578165 isoform X1 [Apis mellifera]
MLPGKNPTHGNFALTSSSSITSKNALPILSYLKLSHRSRHFHTDDDLEYRLPAYIENVSARCIPKRGGGNLEEEIWPIPSLEGSRDLEYRGRRKVIVLDPKDPCVSTEEESAAASYFDRVAGRHVGDNEALGSASDADHRSCDNYGETRLRRLTFTGSNFPRIPGTLRGRNTDILKRVK